MSRVIIIGGGAAGLITLYYFKQAHKFFPGIEPFQVKLLEAEDDIGGTFRYRTYREAELVSSKYLTAFSEWRLPKDAPDFLSADAYLAYLEDFAKVNRLEANIECRTKVVSVTPIKSSGFTTGVEHAVSVEKRAEGRSFTSRGPGDAALQTAKYFCDVLVVCTGLNVHPNIPKIPGLLSDAQDTPMKQPFPVIHSAHFKNYKGVANEFQEKETVVVLGAGETGHDVAALAVTHPHVRRVLMCHRNGFFVAPKVVPQPLVLGLPNKSADQKPNKPLDTCTASLFDTAYVPPVLQRGPLLWEYYDKWVKGMFWAISGTSVGLDQWAGGMDWRRWHVDSVFAVKTNKAIPYISAPFRSTFKERPLNWLRGRFLNVEIPQTDPKRVIELAPWPEKVEGGAMIFPPNDSPESKQLQRNIAKRGPVRPDLVVLATGYCRSVPFLDKSYPGPDAAETRGIYRHIEDGLAYIGFCRPSVGAIPPLAELQAQLFVASWIKYQSLRVVQTGVVLSPAALNCHRRDPNALAPYELDYALHARRGYDLATTKGGVDHESYAYQLALDMGAAPTATHVLRTLGWKGFFTWAMGPNFNIKFRLVGPWAVPAKAKGIMESELYPAVRRTGGLVFFMTFTLVPLILFGILSFAVEFVMAGWALLEVVAEALVLPPWERQVGSVSK